MPILPLPPVDWNHYKHTVVIELQKSNFATVCSGILISPKVVLTTAHCLEDLKAASISSEKLLTPTSKRYDVAKWKIHPNYKGNIVGEGNDIGLVFLKKPVENFEHVKFSNYNPSALFKRIGFGLRNGENRRTLITSEFDEMAGDYLRVKDNYGYPGDSGGPVFQEINEELTLVGLHTGRQTNNAILYNKSYIQPLNSQDVISWILTAP